jgi:hypothetical protein
MTGPRRVATRFTGGTFDRITVVSRDLIAMLKLGRTHERRVL